MKQFGKFLMTLSSLALTTVLPLSCSHNHVSDETSESSVLLSANDTVLLLDDVVRRIPEGMEPADSAALFRRIVDNWVESIVLARFAAPKLPGTDEIDRKVEAYRNRLIVAEYLQMMEASRNYTVASDTVKAFYDSHRKDLVLEVPLVKGIFLKMPSDLQGLEEVKELLKNPIGRNLDEIDNKWATVALRYEYFPDRWVDWNSVSQLIPYRFYDAEAFLESTKDFETTYNGSVYLLHISEWLRPGSEMPYEYAVPQIKSLMERARISDYEDALVKSLVKKAVSEGILTPGSYDPIAKSMKSKNPQGKR